MDKRINSKLRLSIPHNWQKDLFEGIDLSRVGEFYGKLEEDIVGGGRASNISTPVTRGLVKREIRKIHSKGIKFNYLLNSSCLDNQELSVSLQKKLLKLLDWLKDSGVDSVTVTLPFILEFIKANYHDFKINVSTMAHVDTPDKAKFWEDSGAAKITLSEITVNRNFSLIEKIRKSVRCELQLIANNGCLFNCPFTFSHGLLCSHASQTGHVLSGFAIDFYRIMCTSLRIKDPANFIRADWIRPEDLSFYEDLGINSIKIVNRGMSTQAIKRIVDAYTIESYEGNLLDLLPGPSKNISIKKMNPIRLMRYFFRPQLFNIFELNSIRSIFNDGFIYVDNRTLNGFLPSLQDKGCGINACGNCNFCKETADRVVKIDPNRIAQAEKEAGALVDKLVSGEFFHYF